MTNAPGDIGGTQGLIGVNYYGDWIIDPAHYDGPHRVNPMGAGLPPVCSCGWTPHGDFTMADHLADMGEYVDGVTS